MATPALVIGSPMGFSSTFSSVLPRFSAQLPFAPPHYTQEYFLAPPLYGMQPTRGHESRESKVVIPKAVRPGEGIGVPVHPVLSGVHNIGSLSHSAFFKYSTRPMALSLPEQSTQKQPENTQAEFKARASVV